MKYYRGDADNVHRFVDDDLMGADSTIDEYNTKHKNSDLFFGHRQTYKRQTAGVSIHYIRKKSSRALSCCSLGKSHCHVGRKSDTLLSWSVHGPFPRVSIFLPSLFSTPFLAVCLSVLQVSYHI